MKFGNLSGSRNQRRRRHAAFHPSAAELLEARSLLTAGPMVLTPVDTVTTATPEISWEAVDSAVSYDVWVSDMDSRSVLFVEEGIPTTHFTPATELNQGRIRVWVRAQFADDSYSDWGANHDFVVQVTPTVTGPVNTELPGTPNRIDNTTPTITWDAAPGNWRFEIFLSNQTALTSTTYTVQNLTPVLDENGDVIPDGNGDVLREEIRSFELPTSQSLAQFQVFVRAIDDAGRVTEWSPVYKFDVAPKTEILRPLAPSFDDSPLLEWSAVPGATHYDVWVTTQSDYNDWVDGGKVGPLSELYRAKYNVGTSYQIPDDLADGDYVFWVQAINITSGRPQVRGIWSDTAHFATLRKPVIDGPAGVDEGDDSVRTVTDAHPVVTWTEIDQAARYEIWVDRTQGPAKYVLANTSVPSYQFTTPIDPGNYWVWVRALSTTGEATDWSDPYLFTATGGAPIITSPDNNGPALPLPTFTWTPVGEAASYEIWVAWSGVDFDYLRVGGISETSYTPANPFNPGTYRIWVRAIGADGSAYRWSESVTFIVAQADQPGAESTDPAALLTALDSERDAPPQTPVAPAKAADVTERTDAPARPDAPHVHRPIVADAALAESTGSSVTAAELPQELITRLAAEGTLADWWAEGESSNA